MSNNFREGSEFDPQRVYRHLVENFWFLAKDFKNVISIVSSVYSRFIPAFARCSEQISALMCSAIYGRGRRKHRTKIHKPMLIIPGVHNLFTVSRCNIVVNARRMSCSSVCNDYKYPPPQPQLAMEERIQKSRQVLHSAAESSQGPKGHKMKLATAKDLLQRLHKHHGIPPTFSSSNRPFSPDSAVESLLPTTRFS